MRMLRWLGLAFLLVAAIAASLAPFLIDDQPVTFDYFLNTTMPLWYLGAGLVVMAKRPWHQIGWLMLLIGLGLTTTSLPVPASRLDPEWYPWLAWIGTSSSSTFKTLSTTSDWTSNFGRRRATCGLATATN